MFRKCIGVQHLGFVFLFVLNGIISFGQQAPSAVFPGRKQVGPTAASAQRMPAALTLGRQSRSEFRLQALSQVEKIPSRAGLVASGLQREIPQGALTKGQIQTLPDGRRVWHLRLASPDAEQLRLYFEDFDATGGSLWLYSDTGEPEGPFTGRGPLDDGTFWSPTITSSSIIVEFQEDTPDSLIQFPPFTIRHLSHRWSQTPTPVEVIPLATPPLTEPRSALSCHVDATCFPQFAAQSSATVQFNFEADDGGSYVCSGSMINTRNSSFRPYMFTANHCLSSEAEARSVEAFFQYATPTCDGTPPAKTRLPKVLGARFLEGGSFGEGDFALVLLNGDAPAGTTFLGYNSGGFELGGTAIGLHHPAGSFRRFARGTRIADRTGRVQGETAPADRFFQIQYTTGLTEGGSSGSPLINSENQIIGILSYGPVPPPGRTLCDQNPRTAGYGRFANAFLRIQRYLDEQPPPTTGLTVSPTTLNFTVANGEITSPNPVTIRVTTNSLTPITLATISSDTWLRVQSASGFLSITQPANILVTVDPSQFSRSGTTTATLRVIAGASTPVLVNATAVVTSRQSNVSILVNPNPVYESAPDEDGLAWFYTLSLQENGANPTRITSLSIGETSYNADIVDFFGTDRLNASGLLSVNLGARGLRAPLDRTFVVGGVDTETGRTWTSTTTARFLPRTLGSVVSLSSSPSIVRNNPASTTCPWFHQLVITEIAGFPFTINRFIAAGSNLTSDIVNYFGTNRLAANGSLSGGICWTGIIAPEVLEFEISGIDSNGIPVIISTTASFTGPLANPGRLTVSPTSISRLATAITPGQISVTLPANADWTSRLVFPAMPKTWLSVFPLSGRGPANLTVNLSSSGLNPGIYSATLLLESNTTLPQLFSIPIQLTVGGGGSAADINPAGLVNNASYQAGAAPGMLMSVFGLRLAPGTGQAQALPLPTTLQGVSAAINGRTAPLLFVSPGQINLQVPYETEPGTATLTVTVNGVTSRQTLPIFPSLPGIYTSDGRNIVPLPTGTAGQPFVFFLTGQGAVTPTVPTGQAPPNSLPINGLPQPRLPLQVTVAGQPATLLFAGIPYGLTGVMQINIVIPAGLPPGEHPIVVRVGERVSPPAFVRL